MNHKQIKMVSLIMICAMTALQLSACAGSAGVSGGDDKLPSVETIGEVESVSAPAEEIKTSESPVISESAVPSAEWQREVTFPDQAGYTDDTLVMNSEVPFTCYRGQGKLYLTLSGEVKSFCLYINNKKTDTQALAGGKSYEVDFSGASVNGRNMLQISDIRPENGTIQAFIPYPVVTDGDAEGVIDENALSLIGDIIESDIEHGFTSAQLAVIKDGSLIYEDAWGFLNSYDKDGTRRMDGTPVTTKTLFDLASNTKMYSVVYAVQYLVTRGELTMDTRISDILGSSFYEDTIFIDYADYDVPELDVNKSWKKGLTVRDVMMHRAGFPASPGYHKEKYDQENGDWNTDIDNVLYSGYDGSEDTRKKTLSSINKTPLMYEPGTKTLYSDVDYMLLCFCVEKLTGEGIDDFLKKTFWEPMGLDRITFNPLENGFSAEDCAATELNGNTRDGLVDFKGVRKDTIQGEVHDEAAYYAMGGISGHAGMFATASDLAKLASLMLTGGYGDHRFFSQEVMDAFTAPQSDTSSNWGVGWYREGDQKRAWYFGGASSPDTVGHQGWTGTLTMIDPDENLVIVYLTNKRNSPVTDKDYDSNKFDGNWYTASTLGFVPQLLFHGIDESGGDIEQQLYSLLTDMVKGKFRLIKDASEKAAAGNAGSRPVDSDHPVVKAGYSLMEVYLDWSARLGYKLSDENVQEITSLLDSGRDSDEIQLIQEKYG